MGLLHPAGLLLLALVPALVLAYLARERPRRVTVSSVMAFRALRSPGAERFMGRPRFTWTFYVELAMLLLGVFAIAGPYVLRRQSPIAIVLDNSAAMQPQIAAGGSRFDKTRRQLDAALAGIGGDHRVSLYLTAPEPHQAGTELASVEE